MKPLPLKIRSGRAPVVKRGSDDPARGMELALTIAGFIALGWLLDRWLGTAPVFTIVLLLIGAVGVFAQMRYSYEVSMQRLEAERRQRTQASPAAPSQLPVNVEDVP